MKQTLYLLSLIFLYFAVGLLYILKEIRDLRSMFIDNGTISQKESSLANISINTVSVSTITSVADELSSSSYKYFMYNDSAMQRRDIIEKATKRNFTWNRTFGHYFKGYVNWEIKYLKALASHPFRTYNASEADFVIIPILFAPFLMAGSAADIRQAIDVLYEKPLFQSDPSSHVLFTFIEYMFIDEWDSTITGMDSNDYSRLSNTTIVQYIDSHMMQHIQSEEKIMSRLVKSGWKFNFVPMSKTGWSLSLAGAATEMKRALKNPMTIHDFRNKKFHFFYHTRTSPSNFNSTPYRHALVQPGVSSKLIQPSSIGYDIDPTEWRREFSDSKFCITIRGDNPQSRSVWRAIQNSCIPIIISDVWPYYAPIFRSQLNMTDYSILISEEKFMEDPAKAVNDATANLTDEEISRLIMGVNLVQRMIDPIHSESLFVEAFCRETIASRSKEYNSEHAFKSIKGFFQEMT